jgi:hypothetical protein
MLVLASGIQRQESGCRLATNMTIVGRCKRLAKPSLVMSGQMGRDGLSSRESARDPGDRMRRSLTRMLSRALRTQKTGAGPDTCDNAL